MRPLFNSNMTKVSVLKWSHNWTRTIRSGVFGIPKYLKNACKAGYFNFFGYVKNTTSDGPTSILRALYNRYFCHFTIEKWSQICTMTIINDFFKDIKFLALFHIVIPIVNIIANFDHERVELSPWKVLWLISAPKDTINNLSRHVWMFFTKSTRPTGTCQHFLFFFI